MQRATGAHDAKTVPDLADELGAGAAKRSGSGGAGLGQQANGRTSDGQRQQRPGRPIFAISPTATPHDPAAFRTAEADFVPAARGDGDLDLAEVEPQRVREVVEEGCEEAGHAAASRCAEGPASAGSASLQTLSKQWLAGRRFNPPSRVPTVVAAKPPTEGKLEMDDQDLRERVAGLYIVVMALAEQLCERDPAVASGLEAVMNSALSKLPAERQKSVFAEVLRAAVQAAEVGRGIGEGR